MSKAVIRKTAVIALAAIVGLSAAQSALADSRKARGPAGPPPGARLGPCGASALTGQAPAIMTYDKSTGTQVFIGGKAETEVSAYNRETGSAAALKGDLGRPGVVSSCSNDGVTKDSYAVSSDGPGRLTVVGREGATGQPWGLTHGPGDETQWFGQQHRCFKAGLGLFGPSGGFGPAIAGGPAISAVGVAAGDGFVGLGSSVRDGQLAVGLVGC